MAALPSALAGRIAVAVVAAFVGFLMVSQFRGQQGLTQRLESESEGDLARILASINAEADALRDEIGALKLQLLGLQASSAREDAATRASREQLDALEVLAGRLPVHGTGVEVAIADPRRALGYEALIDVVQELRDAGAEAVAVNDRRVGVTSAFTEEDGRIQLDGAPLVPPYVVRAIGEPATLDGGLAIPGGAVDTLSSAKGVNVSVTRAADVRIPALVDAPTFRVARPVASDE